MFEVKYSILDKIKPLIDAAKEAEKTVHRSARDEKAADWMVRAANEAELPLDDEL
jgi:hypothetical protein